MRTIIVTDTWPRAQIVAEELGVRKAKIWWVYDHAQIMGVSLETPVVIDIERSASLQNWKELRHHLYRFKDVNTYTSPRRKA